MLLVLAVITFCDGLANSGAKLQKKSYDCLMTYVYILSQTYDKVTIVRNYKRIL